MDLAPKTEEHDRKRLNPHRLYVRGAGLLAIFVGLIVIVGWAPVTAKPFTALAFMLTGIALLPLVLPLSTADPNMSVETRVNE